MQLPIPVCHSNPWPSEYASALSKFAVFDQRMRNLFSLRDRNFENPQISVWSMSQSDPVFSSSCLLWDVLHVYHLMGTLAWNEAVSQFSDHKQARALFLESHKYFRAISERIMPAWLPSCRSVQRHEKDGSLKLMFPSFLVNDTWKYWANLSLGMVHRVMIDKALYMEKKSTNLVSKIAMGGYQLLQQLPRTEQKQLSKLVREQSDILRIYALVYWARTSENSADPTIHGKRVKILKDLALCVTNLPGLENLKEEALNCEQMNNSVYFQNVPKDDVEKEILANLQSTNVTDKDVTCPTFSCM